jgi:hypothetical protein
MIRNAFIVALLLLPAIAFADPCLIVYPSSNTVYHYDVNEYYTVGMGHPLYDAMYDRGGEVLIDINTDEIAYNIYQAPNLVGFTPSTNGEEGYFIADVAFDLILDGFSNEPTTYENIYLVFEPIPDDCATLNVMVDGNPVMGGMYNVGDLAVSTPTPDGNNYSDTMTFYVEWSGCPGFLVWAFADDNYNGVRDGGECFTAFSHDLTVPTKDTTWGAIKTMYGE